MILKIQVFWDVTLSLSEELATKLFMDPDDEGTTILRNVGNS
jgi:hypothetical protein